MAQESSEELRQKLEKLEERIEQMEMDMLQGQAERAAREQETDALKPVAFHGKGRALQMLNPELSVEVEVFGAAIYQDGQLYQKADDRPYAEEYRSGFFLREAAFHFQSVLDPYSLMKASVALDHEGAHLEEAYVTYSSFLPRLNLTLGRFRQSFGTINRWHRHSLDQFDFPLMLRIPFGPEGICQTGLSLQWLMPPWWASSQTLELQVTNSENEHFLAGEFFSLPSGLARLKNYWDLNRNTYLEAGFSGFAGFRNRVNWQDEDGVVQVDEDPDLAYAAGFDITLNWEPVHKANRRGIIWRTEGLYARKKDDNGMEADFWGGYSYLQGKARRNLFFGVRGDLVRHFRQSSEDDRYMWQASPYITWHQSEFVYLRLEYDLVRDHCMPDEHRVFLQMTFAAGPHKHERY